MIKLLSAVVFVGVCASAQTFQSAPSLTNMLDDSAYVFNRYDELVGNLSCDTLTQASPSFRETCRAEISTINSSVARTKETLSTVRRANNPALSDLFTIYRELMEVAGAEEQFSNNIADFSTDTDSSRSVSFADAGAKALKLAANLGNLVLARIDFLELKCRQNTTR